MIVNYTFLTVFESFIFIDYSLEKYIDTINHKIIYFFLILILISTLCAMLFMRKTLRVCEMFF